MSISVNKITTQITTPLAVPLPLVDDQLGMLGKAVLDLISGYWQIIMDEADKEKKRRYARRIEGYISSKLCLLV